MKLAHGQEPNQPRSIGHRLLWSVNTILGIGLLSFLMFLYLHEVHQRLKDRYESLHDQAAVILDGVAELRGQGLPEIQEYVNAASRLMRGTAVPLSHYIVVRVGTAVLESGIARPATGRFYAAVRRGARSPTHQALAGAQRIMVADVSQGDIQLYIGESVAGLESRIRDQILLWLAVVAAVGVAITVVVSMVLVRLVTQPLQRLVAAVDRIGRRDFDGDILEIHSSREMAVLSSAINAMRVALGGAQREDRQRIAKARRIQQHLLPVVPTGSEQIACEYKPAAIVGGDYFDFQMLSSGELIACVADVSGHGVPAAISAAMLKTLFIAAVSRTSDPAEGLTMMNAGFTQVALEEDFASIILVRLNSAGRTLQYASAGHETCYLVRAHGPVEVLHSTGGLLGLVTPTQWTSKMVAINSGDRIILVTDGVSETASPDGVLFGRQRIQDMLEANCKEPPNVVAQRLLSAVELWRQGGAQMDDVTILVIAVG